MKSKQQSTDEVELLVSSYFQTCVRTAKVPPLPDYVQITHPKPKPRLWDFLTEVAAVLILVFAVSFLYMNTVTDSILSKRVTMLYEEKHVDKVIMTALDETRQFLNYHFIEKRSVRHSKLFLNGGA